MPLKCLLMLLPIFLLTQQTWESLTVADAYAYKLSVKSKNENVELFDLMIEGEKSVTANGSTKAFHLKKRNLRTPYQLNLGNGQYRIVVERQSNDGVIISKLQTFDGGRELGYCENDVRKTRLEALPFSCAAGGEE